MIGMEPGISIMANNTINDANISTMLKFIIRGFKRINRKVC